MQTPQIMAPNQELSNLLLKVMCFIFILFILVSKILQNLTHSSTTIFQRKWTAAMKETLGS